MGIIPFRLDEYRAKIQFMTFAKMPSLITKAAKKHGYVSNTQYIQHRLCEALARDLELDLDDLKDSLPPPSGGAAHFLKKHESI